MQLQWCPCSPTSAPCLPTFALPITIALPAHSPARLPACLAQEDEEAGGARVGSARRRMLRRNSVSMILENPVLAQVCLGEELAGNGERGLQNSTRHGRCALTSSAQWVF